MSIPFKGTRWFKCDLHLHTPASKCFQDQTVTPEQWVAKAIDKELNCVAITDHNTGEWVDKIKIAAKDKDLIVFPGVEITCDTSKIHLLILFDVIKTTNDVNDFLIKCNIERKNFGEIEAHTSINIFDVADIAHQAGALVIPAHIDEYNGLESTSDAILKQFFALEYINAIQLVHKEFLDTTLKIAGNEALKKTLNEYHDNPKIQIDDATIKKWYTPVKNAINSNLALLTFSDNPHSPKNPKHGLDGIGEKYTWIKMDEHPTLEGLRQAFLLPEYRVQNVFVSEKIPFSFPDLWIKSISIFKTTTTGPETPLKIEFSPQLTTIIGGRGSGKSSILRFLRGIFNKNLDIKFLEDILEDQNEFYKKFDTKTKKGVITSDSVIEVEFVRNNVLYKIVASNITTSKKQSIIVYKYDFSEGLWITETAEHFIDFFEFDQYSQKQIYEIAQEPNSLRERIDNSITGMKELKNERENIKNNFFEKSVSIRKMQQQISGKGKLQTEIGDIKERIKIYNNSGIAGILSSREKFTTQKKVISKFIAELKKREELIESIIPNFEVSDIDFSFFVTEHSSELSKYSKTAIDSLASIKSELEKLKTKASQIHVKFNADSLKSQWKKDFDKNESEFNVKKDELEKQGIDDIANFEKLTLSKETKEKDLKAIEKIETTLNLEILSRQQLQLDYFSKTQEITIQRQAYVNENMQDEKVKVSLKPFQNRADFINKLRTIIQRSDSFQDDIDFLTNLIFRGSFELNIVKFRDILLNIRKDTPTPGISGYFVNLIKGLSDAQIDELDLLLPEDEIVINYKPTGEKQFKPLSTASAGQKTTAILTFILTQGNKPLILDQPEDDLDNRLVYELVVDRLKLAKKHRQIIVVTHNANIPVNGDSEYIISMNAESKKLEVFCSGTVEQAAIKKEICDVMEGGEHAFEMRLKRYKTTK